MKTIKGIKGLLFFVFFCTTQLFLSGVCYSNDINHASFITQTVPDKLISGEKAKVSISFKNSSGKEWANPKEFKLKDITQTGNASWGADEIKPTSGDAILQGGFINYEFEVTAPTKPGIYQFQWQLADSKGGLFGDKSRAVLINVEDNTLQSEFISQLVSNTLETNKNYKVTLQFKNIGTETWNKGDVALVPKSKRIKNTWGTNNVALPKSVAPGESVNITIPVRTPKSNGSYPFQWRLVKNGKAFGEASPWISIRVEKGTSGNQAEFVYQNVKETMIAGKQYNVSVVMKNVGTTSWYPRIVTLDSQKPAGNLNWFINNITLASNEVVKPGNIKIFNFTVMAPIDPGVYSFKWQLKDKDKGWFGQPSEGLEIRVIEK